MASPRHGLHSVIEGPWSIVSVVCTPINLIHNSTLSSRRNGGHREIGIASEVTKECDLAVDTTPSPVRPRVIERPVSVNEREDRAAVLLPQQPMILRKSLAVFANLSREGVRRVVVVMQMHFDIAHAKTNHLRDALEQIATVLFLRIEKAILRRLSAGVRRSVVGYARPSIAPASNSTLGGLD